MSGGYRLNALVLYVRALASAAFLSAMIFGTPILLVVMVDNPLPDWEALKVGDYSDDTILHLGATAALLLWGLAVLLIAVEARAQVVHRPPPTLPGLAGGQRAIRPYITALMLSAPTIAATATAAAPLVHPVPPTHASADLSAPTLSPGSGGTADTGNGPAGSSSGSGTQQVPQTEHETARALKAELMARYSTTSAPDTHQGAPAGTTGRVDQQGRPASVGSASSGSHEEYLLGMGSGIGLSLTAATFYTVIQRRRRHHAAARRPGKLPAAIPADVAVIERRLKDGADLAREVRESLDTALDALDEALAPTGATVDILAARLDAQRIDIILRASQAQQPLPEPWQHDPRSGTWFRTAPVLADGEARTAFAGDENHRPTEQAEEPGSRARMWAWIGSSTPSAPNGASAAPHDGDEEHDGEVGSGDVWLLNLQAAPAIRVIGPDQPATDLVLAMTLSLDQSSPSRSDRPRVHVHSGGAELAVLEDLLPARATTAAGGPTPKATPDVPDDTLTLHIVDDIRPSHPETAAGGQALAAPGTSVLTVTQDLGSARRDEVRLILDITGQLHTSFTHEPLTAAQVTGSHLQHLAPALHAAQAPATREPPLLTRPAATSPSSTTRATAPVDVLGMPRPTTPVRPRTGTETRPTTRSHAPNQPPARRISPYDTPPDEAPADPEPTYAEDREEASLPAGSDTDADTDPSAPTEEGLRRVSAATGVSADDLLALTPTLSPSQRATYAADPTLDADLQQWHADTCPRPRLRVLGTIDVRATGTLPAGGRRLPWWTEIVVLLAAHPEGLTYEQIAAYLWPDDADNKAAGAMPRQAISSIRPWLGTNPDTGKPYLPEGSHGGWQRGTFRIDDLLLDADLARRLRTRALARGGPEGQRDLEAALALVTGPVLNGRRDNGYGWLTHEPALGSLTSMISDIAHTLAIHWMSTGKPERATDVALTAHLAGSRDDITHLDLIAAASARGLNNEADQWLSQLLAIHSAEVEEDLPPDTYKRLQHIRRQLSAS